MDSSDIAAAGLVDPEELQSVNVEKLKGRLAELLRDDEDVLQSSDVANGQTHKPGSITPLGVRVDRGQGLLSSASATAIVSEMDTAILGIRQWQQKRERDLAAMMARNEAALEQAYQPAEPISVEDGLGSPSTSEAHLDHDALAHDARHGTVDSAGTGPWAIAAGNTRPQTTAEAGLGASASVFMSAKRFDRMGALGWQAGTELRTSVPRAGSGRGGTDSRRGFVQQLRTSAGAAASMAARPLAPDEMSVVAMTGEQAELLKQLELELQELDEAIDGPDESISWQAEVGSALARLDALQTGYQSKAT